MRFSALLLLSLVALFSVLCLAAAAPPPPPPPTGPGPKPSPKPSSSPKPSPAPSTPPPPPPPPPFPQPPVATQRFRTIDGKRNNPLNSALGSAPLNWIRKLPANYPGDGSGEEMIDAADSISARRISNLVHAATVGESKLSAARLNDLFWSFGQFLDHDIDLTITHINTNPNDGAVGVANECSPIPIVDADDLFFTSGGQTEIPFCRSEYDEETNPRLQINFITAFTDASMVYGSTETRAKALRSFVNGKLKTSTGDMLPFDENNMDGFGTSGYLAGDIRANEQPSLLSFQTLFLREHNRLCDMYLAAYPNMTDEELYQRARLVLGAEWQRIVYNEFLPILLGPNALPQYSCYNPNVNPTVSAEWATAAFRIGHTMVSDSLLFIDDAGNQTSSPLSAEFFNPFGVVHTQGIDVVLRGAFHQRAQEVDVELVESLRNFLFGQPGAGGLDLAALNIQRGRDHGMPTFAQARAALNLQPVVTFSDITSDAATQLRLQAAYGTPDKVELWTGGLAEDKVPGAQVGSVFRALLVDQFLRLRDGDRFWYDSPGVLTADQLAYVRTRTLGAIIRDNTGVKNISDDVFHVPV